MKKIFSSFVAAGLLALVALNGCTCSKEKQSEGIVQKSDVKGNLLVIETDYGNIECELYSKDAPKTVSRIKELASSGFYNGLTFHRVVPGFVIQGGDPKGDGTGGSGKKLVAEFNSHQHMEGTLAMARAADPNSADSQFYISLGRHAHLDNNYTVFGQCLTGLDAVKKVKKGDKMHKVYVK